MTHSFRRVKEKSFEKFHLYPFIAINITVFFIVYYIPLNKVNLSCYLKCFVSQKETLFPLYINYRYETEKVKA